MFPFNLKARLSKNVSKVRTSNGPIPFLGFGGRAKAILAKDYKVGDMFTLSFPNSSGMGVTATGLKRGHAFSGAISAVYKCENSSIVMKIDSDSTVKVNVTRAYIFGNTKATLSFNALDHKSGMLSVKYSHPFASMCSSIGLNSTPSIALTAVIGTKDLSLGGRTNFDMASATFKRLAAGITYDKPDFSASLTLEEQGQKLKGSFVHVLTNSSTTVAAEMTHTFLSNRNSFSFGSAYNINPTTVVKARFSESRKIAILCRHEWRPKSQVTFLAEYDTKPMRHPKFGLTLSLNPQGLRSQDSAAAYDHIHKS